MTFNLIPGQFRKKKKSFMNTHVFKSLVITDLLSKLASNYCEQYFATTRRIRVKLKYGQQLYDMWTMCNCSIPLNIQAEQI